MSTAQIARAFLAGAQEAQDVAVVAVASRDGRRAQAFAREHGIKRSHDSYEALLSDPDVEAVYIPLPNSLHISWAVHALQAGKHVLCEKPLSRRPEQVEFAFDLAHQRGLLLMEAFMYRHNPQTARLNELVQQGAVGTLRMIRAAFSFVASDPVDVRLSHELDGGALMDLGCYCVSAARMLAGEPDQVSAFQTLGGNGVDVAFTGIMSFAGGVLAHFDSGLALAQRHELEVVGDEGTLFLDDPWACRKPLIELRRPDLVERIRTPLADSYGLEVENFSAAIRGEAASLLGRADAVGQARTIEALYSAAEGRNGFSGPSASWLV